MTGRADKASAPPPEEYEIVIADDGQVIFRTATAEMLDLALLLAPEDQRLRRLHSRRRRAAEGKANEERATGRD